MKIGVLTCSMLGERVCSSRLIVSERFGLRGVREYGSCEPYKSGLATFNKQTFCTKSTMANPCSFPYAKLFERKWREN